jgi:hypothetical protein
MRLASIAIMTAFMAFTGISATAEEKPVRLRQAPGLEKVEAQCSACHSLDYVQMNSPFLSAAGWDAEVAKMINAFGAQIDEADAKTLADYLKKNYGIESLGQNKARSAGIEKVEERYDTNSSRTPRRAAIRSAHTPALANGPRSKAVTHWPALKFNFVRTRFFYFSEWKSKLSRKRALQLTPADLGG